MRKFDHNGILLAEYQAKIFERSIDYSSCSSLVFLRRFMKSNVAKKIDKNNSYALSLDYLEALNDIKEEFGESHYGVEKYSKNEMFWMGYIYRYICYTRNCSTRFIFKLIPPKELREYYKVYHTQSEEYFVSSLLEIKKIDEDYFDINKRLKLKLLKTRNFTF